jgi:AraC-like DNA-binding protein
MVNDAPGARRSDSSTRILTSTNLEIMSDDLRSGGDLFWEDAKGVAGYCEIPPSEMRSAGLSSSAPHEADICLLLIERGTLCIEQGNGIFAKVSAGTVLLRDAAQPMRGYWDGARFGYVKPSRQRLMQLLGHIPGPRERSVETLDYLGLAPFLGSQLSMLMSRGATLAPMDLKHVIGGIFHISEALLKLMFLPEAKGRDEPVSDRLAKVQRFIQRNLHRHDLNVADIALGTNLSRAQLYRHFTSQSKSVYATLREERLQKGLSYLARSENDRLSIGAIAYACGFSDQAVFSKLFRQRFGLTPSEARSRPSIQGRIYSGQGA